MTTILLLIRDSLTLRHCARTRRAQTSVTSTPTLARKSEQRNPVILHFHDDKRSKSGMTGMLLCSECDQGIDLDAVPLPPEPRQTAEEHPVIRSEPFRGLEVIATVRIYDSDAPLDLFWVELFGPIRCDEDDDIDIKGNTFGSREWETHGPSAAPPRMQTFFAPKWLTISVASYEEHSCVYHLQLMDSEACHVCGRDVKEIWQLGCKVVASQQMRAPFVLCASVPLPQPRVWLLRRFFLCSRPVSSMRELTDSCSPCAAAPHPL
jgi:hypothetical protein